MVRFTKIERNFQFFRYFLMFCKFFSIVCCYRMYLTKASVVADNFKLPDLG